MMLLKAAAPLAVADSAKTDKPPAETPKEEHEARFLRATAEVSTEREGRIVVIGTELKEGEKVADKDRVTVTVGFLAVHTGDEAYVPYKEGDPFLPGKLFIAQEKRTYRKLHVGAAVEAGQLIALVDSTPQLNEVALKIAKLETAESEWQASIETKGEATRRAQASELLWSKGKGFISEDIYRADLFNRDRYIEEEKGRHATLRAAKEDLAAALTILKMYEIHSSESGFIREILKRPGEAIRAFEPVVRLEVESDAPGEGQALPTGFNVPAQREGVLLVVGTDLLGEGGESARRPARHGQRRRENLSPPARGRRRRGRRLVGPAGRPAGAVRLGGAEE